MDSQYNHEVLIESYFLNILGRKYNKNGLILQRYHNFKEDKMVPLDLSWEQMKHSYNWGYRKGSLISPLITWIYIRSDIKKDLEVGTLTCKDMIDKLKLNEHYFLVEKRAIEFLKLHCGGFLSSEEFEEDSVESCSSQSEESEPSYQTLKRRRLTTSVPTGIDDFAIEKN